MHFTVHNMKALPLESPDLAPHPEEGNGFRHPATTPIL
jgi:hypothetical protein